MKRLLFLPAILVLLSSANRLRADAVVVFNEIMYHPATNESLNEFVELRNLLAVDVDISDWAITGMIDYTFPSNSIIKGGAHLVVARSPSTMMGVMGTTNVHGPFFNRLENDGGTLRLRNNSGRVMDEVNYETEGDWPVAPDGSGVSLAKREPDSASGNAANWTSSAQMGGSPGAQNFVPSGGFLAPPGLISYWNFNEPSGSSIGDQTTANPGTLGSGVSRLNTPVGRALSFNGTTNAFANVGAGGSFGVSGGITIEALLTPGWSTTNTAVIFRKAPRRPPAYSDAVLSNQPVAYWRLGDASTSIADSSGNSRIGAATAGVLLNQPSLIASDPANAAVRATGNERITVPAFEKIGAAGYAVEFWVKVHTLPNACCQSLVGDGEAAGDYFMMNYILGPSQGLTGAIRPHFGPNNTPVSMDSATALQVNNTYHIVTTWDTSQAANNAVIYINGVADRVGTISRNVPAAGTTGNNPVYIGYDNREVPQGNYTYDEVALYNRPLSAADVATHYAAATTVNFDATQGNAVQLAFQSDGNNAAANPPVAAGPVLSFGLTVAGVYSELDMPLDGASGRPTLAALENGQPHHVAATYDSATGVKAIYVDGTLRYSTTLSGTLNTANAANAILGNSEVNGNAPYVGGLDEMAYWGRALSAAEVAAHASASQAGRDYFTTGPQSSLTLAFNEFSAATNTVFWLELINYGTNAIPLEGFAIVLDGPENLYDATYVFPAGPSISAGGYRAVTNTTLGFHPVSGDRLYLLPPARDRVLDSVVVKNGARARSPDGTGPFLRPATASPGGANSFVFHNEIVINEILYDHKLLPATNNLPPLPSREKWVELHNKSASALDLTGWELDGGIGYHFSPGQTIPAGGYLVITDDAAALSARYPGRPIVGDFSGTLSGNSDRLVLRDPAGNPADEVRYFSGGRWPEYANGGGSSLELRDPNADNSKAEAWAASDESGKSSWQTFTYRSVAQGSPTPAPDTVWRDLVFGLQSAGECLIDDISVIESPTNGPIQFIANGNFESDLAGWRVLGTHNRSRVIVDPDNAGNHVLYLVATGPQEHMHNHIEATFTAGRTVANGRQYEISFRARWLAGNNLLNTRLYFNRTPRTTALPYPALNGTPGVANSRLVANLGPTFNSFAHQPIVPQPGSPVTVTVSAQDPQGVASAEVWWSVNSGAWNNAAMPPQGGGGYAGSIPGASAGAIVQFYVRALDSQGAAATFPARGTNSGALYAVADGQANLPLAHNVRIVLTPANTDLLHGTAQGVNQTNVMSNDLLPCTVIYDEARAYYDCGVHLRGSQRGRYSDIRTGFHINFLPDELFRGVHPVMLIDRSGAGDSAANRQEEIVLKHILNRAGGIPGTYGEIARVIAPRSAHTGPCQFFPRHEDNFIETAFPDGGDGTLFEMELIYYPSTANASGYKLPQPDGVQGIDLANFGDDKEPYRYNFMIKNHRDGDDYSRFITLCKTLSLSGAALDAQSREIMDIDQWMRAYALISLCSVGDMYGFGNNHNFFMYQRPSDGKFLYFPWDMDFAFTRGSGGALVGDQNLAKVVNLPGNLRCMYAHMLDIIAISFNTSYMTYWADHYDNFAPGQNYTGGANSLGILGARVPFVINTINSAGGNAPFVVSGPTLITTSNNLVTLSGTAPVQVKTIWINGVEYALTWTSISAWTVRVPIMTTGLSTLNLVGYDVHGNPLTNFTRSIGVNYTGPTPVPEGTVVINEIMYNPATPDTAFIELFNNSPTLGFDLSGWRLNGVDYTFPAGTVLTNRGFLTIANNPQAYSLAYTGAPPAYDRFSGNLQNNGETLSLFRPGAFPGEEILVDRVRYENVLPWPVSANGLGPSLQLIDSTKDNARVANWSDGTGWRFFTASTPMAGPGLTPTNLQLYLQVAGDVYIDDVTIVHGLVAGAGPNLMTNGSFELGMDPWRTNGNHTGSSVVTGIAHDGSNSLHIAATGAGGSLGSVQNVISNLFSTNIATISFWFLPSTNGSGINFRVTSAFRSLAPTDYRPGLPTPGTNNPVAMSLPAFPLVWLNEAQPENLTGLADNHGDREPWVELYNAGPDPVSLEGWYLSTGYESLNQWGFPVGAMLQSGEFKVVICDNEPGESTASEWHTNFRLSPTNGSVALSWSPSGIQILDYLNYADVRTGRAYGDFPDGQPFFREEFYRPTPGATNDHSAAPLTVFINEWMAQNSGSLLNTNNSNQSDDWFEIYNPGNTPADLSGYFVTDNLLNPDQFQIPLGTMIPAHGFLLVWADGRPSLNTNTDPALHVSFKLEQSGEAIGLFGPDGALIDAVTFGPQYSDISEGRYPDGPDAEWLAPFTVPTPRAPNAPYANRYPVLAAIPDTTAYVNLPFQFTAAATDPDVPPQSLLFNLEAGAPTNATLNAATGAFSWIPTASQADTTNVITLRVSDNGIPVLRAERTFTVVVRAAVLLGGITAGPGGTISFKVLTTPGKTYRVEYKNALTDTMWIHLPPDHPANGTSLTINDTIGMMPQRFYQVVELE